MESFLLSISCNPIRKHFLFKLPHSFHFSCWIYNVPKWFANVLLLSEGLTPCHHYLWNGAFLSKDFHWDLCIKEAEDWLFHIISLKLEIKNRKLVLGSTSCLSHSLPLMAFFPQEWEDLEGNRICYLVDIYKCKSSVHICVGFLFFLFFLLQLVLSAWLTLRKDFPCRECGLLCK